MYICPECLLAIQVRGQFSCPKCNIKAVQAEGFGRGSWGKARLPRQEASKAKWKQFLKLFCFKIMNPSITEEEREQIRKEREWIRKEKPSYLIDLSTFSESQMKKIKKDLKEMIGKITQELKSTDFKIDSHSIIIDTKPADKYGNIPYQSIGLSIFLREKIEFSLQEGIATRTIKLLIGAWKSSDNIISKQKIIKGFEESLLPFLNIEFKLAPIFYEIRRVAEKTW